LTPLEARYGAYIDCLNRREWGRLGEYVAADVVHNGRRLGIDGYRAMLEGDVATFPDLRFEIALLAADRDIVASRIDFHVTPVAPVMGIAPTGATISFSEHVFYRFAEDRIAEVWSLIDRAAIERQLTA
jgi:predicted ester cyclase